MDKRRRTLYYTIGDDKEVYDFIKEQRIEKNFVCSKIEAENMNCSYFDGGVTVAGRYSQSVVSESKNIAKIKIRHKMLFEEVIFINGFGSSYKNILDLQEFAKSFFYELVILIVDHNGFKTTEKKIKLLDHLESGQYNFNYERTSDYKSSFNHFLKTTEELVVCANRFDKVFVFGDIHGCIEPLIDFEKSNGFNNNELYVFLGDYFDRGLDNLEVLKFIISHIDKENFVFIVGNHEKSIYRHFIKNEGANTFTKERYKEFRKGGFNDNQMMDMYNKMVMFYLIEFDGKKYMFNHGGICDKPDRSALETGFIYTNGNKSFDKQVDLEFQDNQLMKNEKDRWIQVHGHRNQNFSCNLFNNQYSHSLECKIEFGGSLGIFIISRDGHKFKYIENFKYSK